MYYDLIIRSHRILILSLITSILAVRHHHNHSHIHQGYLNGGIYGNGGGFHGKLSNCSFPVFSQDSRITYIAEERFYKMITEKRAEVDKLIREHSDMNDKLQLRLNYVQCTMNHKLNEMLKRNSTSASHQLSIIGDMKRRTPTHNPMCDNNILSYTNAAEVALSMANTGFDVIFVNTDETVYGGHIQDLYKSFLELRKLGRRIRPAIVMKDIILHPIQIAQAAEHRADGVILNASILGPALKDMIVACIDMGIEAIVEVHDTAEICTSVDMGATHIMVNQWDRVTNVLYPKRAMELRDEIPSTTTAIACGGIMTMKQVHELALIGYDAICFGRRLKYPDLPDFIKCVKEWKGPSKSILRLSRYSLFDIDEDEDGNVSMTLKNNHLAKLRELNYFYFGEGSDISDFLEFEKLTKPPVEAKPSYTEQALTEEDKARAITLNIGVPTTPDSTTKVGTLAVSVEGQKEYIDENEYFANKRLDMFQLKWFIERKKWLKKNRHLFESEEDANKAYDLKKAIEMYNSFLLLTRPKYKSVLSKKELDDVEESLLNNVKKLYKLAPKIPNLFGQTNIDDSNTPDETIALS